MDPHVPSHDDAALRDYLADRDQPCPGCSYNLRGMISSRCPECNQPLRLAIELVDSGVARTLATVIPPAIAGGAAAICAVVVVTISALTHDWPQGYQLTILLYYPAGAALLLLVPAIALMTARGRLWLRTRTRPTSRRLIALLSGCSGAAIVVWIGLVLYHA